MMSLNQYNKKRDFSKTAEPKGTSTKDPQYLYVIQKHAASHLHYDFRIELDGVLKSWAVPKGPSLDPEVKRLAIHVEDHPVNYGRFEGIIPKGQYGGGTVMLWDKGTWEPLDSDPKQAYQKGHIRFNLHAEKLNGRWDLIRFKDEKHWFLIKFKDEFSRPQKDYDITTHLDKSVLSHQDITEIAKHYERIWNSDEQTKVSHKKKTNKKPIILLPQGLKKTTYPDFIAPELAMLVDKAPEGEQWLHEIKFDGYRVIAYKQGTHVVLKSRNNINWTFDFTSVAAAVRDLPVDHLILDGEVVVLDKQGKSDFQLLQNAIKNKDESTFIYYVFDLLYYDQYDLRQLPLLERKSILQKVIQNNSPLIYSDHIINDGQKMFEHSCHMGLEGIISKRADSAYSSKRGKDWLKIKCIKRQEFVIGGYTDPQGKRQHFGALLLGVYNKDGLLEYVGNVGTGFSQTALTEIHQYLLQNQSSSNPFTLKPPGYSKIHWVNPLLVAEVEFTEWTDDGHLRHPSFKGLRLDKKAEDVMREQPASQGKIQTKQAQAKKHKTKFVLSHPDKILYPEDKITKQEILAYYEQISDYILPYVSLRPLTLLRCPSGYNDKCFYQRHYNKTTPNQLHSIEIEQEQYIYLNDKEGLLSLVQMGVLEIHPWGCTIHNLEHPDIIVIDLDPGPDVPWTKVVAAAKEVRHHLMQYKLQSFVKSTGGKGLHVVIPVLPENDWEEVKEFTHVFVQFLEKLKPDEYASTMSKSKRNGKIFIDYLRNQRTATAIGTYSTRARIHAPVSASLAWEELSGKIEDNTYTIKTLPQRLNKLKEDPWKDFWDIKQSLRLDELE
ncbi:DNA ligase D [uncultured Legionella sp.]|uniref:DNA ligase D n=1 Tax=uncultured Legionella sp. TaxID=210934 RepID=UPI002639A95E|nr:DNA ligase D [uncultured Legionella sp.]